MGGKEAEQNEFACVYIVCVLVCIQHKPYWSPFASIIAPFFCMSNIVPNKTNVMHYILVN